MNPKEVVDKVIEDMFKNGEGICYVDPRKFYKRYPWYKRLWSWIKRA